ncbi:hypothetical protein ABMC89_12920 [Sulfitobacter sp. HNIBRBA3233]|uniref:hypothetical protein n=1 Tax=Sulfitobacter marinivivus TaxID=3158558 RepID=UPI0032DE760E
MKTRFDYPAALSERPFDTGPDNTRIYWRNDKGRDPALLVVQSDFARPEARGDQTLLKRGRQRFIFRQRLGRRSYVVKLFPLSFI